MTIHTPVLLQEIIQILKPSPGRTFIDATFGGGGHSIALASQGAKVIALDRDPNSVEEGERLLARACLNSSSSNKDGGLQTFLFPRGGSLTLQHENFRNLTSLVQQRVDGILFDLGLSSDQIASERGFSFQKDSALDMRFDPKRESVRAADLLNALSEKELADIFSKLGNEPKSRPIAHQIVQARQNRPFETTGQLVDLINRISPARGKIHPATKVFQALRMAVNTEITDLETGLEAAWDLLVPGGKILIITFHSGEDNIVKNFARKHHAMSELITPTPSEIVKNRRSRSAKLRVIIKK